MAGRYTWTAGVNGSQAGNYLGPAGTNYAIAGSDILGPENLGSVATPETPAQNYVDSGVYLPMVLKLARSKLIHPNPSWINPMPLSAGHKPVATYFKWGEIDLQSGAIDADPTVFKLMEGITPSHNLKMGVTTDTISPEVYGLVTYYSDQIGAVSFINFKTQLVERLAYGIGRIIDSITRLHLKNNLSLETSVITAEGSGPISWKRLVRLRAVLDARDVSPPNGGDLWPMIIHPNQKADMLMDTQLKASLDFGQRLSPEQIGKLHSAVIGQAAGFEFYSTTRCTTWDGSATNAATAADGTVDGYENFVIGQDLIASTELKAPDVGSSFNLGGVYGMGGADGPGGYNSGNNASWPVQMIEKPFGSGGATGDPLDQVASLGFKATFGLKIVQPLHGTKIRFTSDYD